MPAVDSLVLVLAGENLKLERLAARSGEVDLMSDVAVSGTDDSLDSGGVEAVLEVVLDQQVCRRNDDRAELMQCDYCIPEVVVTLEDYHDAVALADAERLKIVRGPRRLARYIAECEAAFMLFGVEVEHRELVGILRRYSVDNVIREVEFVLVLEFDAVENAVFVDGRLNEILPDRSRFCVRVDTRLHLERRGVILVCLALRVDYNS